MHREELSRHADLKGKQSRCILYSCCKSPTAASQNRVSDGHWFKPSRRSSPERVTPDGMKIEYSCVAQLAEHPTVNRTVTGSSPVAGAIESLGSPRLFYFHRIGDQTRHPIINREIHGEDLTTTHIRQTGHCQFTDERHGIPSISLGIPRKSYIETLVRGMAESIGKSGALGATPASTRFTPSMATMAPLSVQSLICGIRTSTP